MSESLKPWEKNALYDLRKALLGWPATLTLKLREGCLVVTKDGIEIESFVVHVPSLVPPP